MTKRTASQISYSPVSLDFRVTGTLRSVDRKNPEEIQMEEILRWYFIASTVRQGLNEFRRCINHILKMSKNNRTEHNASTF